MADPRRSSIKKRNGTSARRKIPISVIEEEMEKELKKDEISESLEEIENPELPPDSKPDAEKLQLQDKLLRLQAEFDNYRKRQARDFRKLCDQGKKELIEELLAVLDNYHRAEQLVNEGGHSVEEIADGLMKTSQQLVDILKQESLEELDIKKGDPFDPNIHEAMLAEDKEGLDQDTVLDVFQKGYRLGEDLLRPARVRVGKPVLKPAAGEQTEGEEGE